MKKFFSFFIILIITTGLFLTIDFFFGEKILVKSKLKIDNTFRIKNNFYHHGFKKIIKQTSLDGDHTHIPFVQIRMVLEVNAMVWNIKNMMLLLLETVLLRVLGLTTKIHLLE